MVSIMDILSGALALMLDVRPNRRKSRVTQQARNVASDIVEEKIDLKLPPSPPGDGSSRGSG